jgi:hypothetical protein
MFVWLAIVKAFGRVGQMRASRRFFRLFPVRAACSAHVLSARTEVDFKQRHTPTLGDWGDSRDAVFFEMFGLLLACDAEALRVGHRKLVTETAGEGRTAGHGGARVKETPSQDFALAIPFCTSTRWGSAVPKGGTD